MVPIFILSLWVDQQLQGTVLPVQCGTRINSLTFSFCSLYTGHARNQFHLEMSTVLALANSMKGKQVLALTKQSHWCRLANTQWQTEKLPPSTWPPVWGRGTWPCDTHEDGAQVSGMQCTGSTAEAHPCSWLQVSHAVVLTPMELETPVYPYVCAITDHWFHNQPSFLYAGPCSSCLSPHNQFYPALK